MLWESEKEIEYLCLSFLPETDCSSNSQDNVFSGEFIVEVVFFAWGDCFLAIFFCDFSLLGLARQLPFEFPISDILQSYARHLARRLTVKRIAVYLFSKYKNMKCQKLRFKQAYSTVSVPN